MTSKAASMAFRWNDPLSLDGQITADERAVRDTAHAYCQEQLLSKVLEAFRHEETDVGVFRGMGELGLLGATIPEAYGGAGLNYVCYGLIAREVERVDSGYRSMMSVQSSLVMVPINEFGNEATRQKYLPKLAVARRWQPISAAAPGVAASPAPTSAHLADLAAAAADVALAHSVILQLRPGLDEGHRSAVRTFLEKVVRVSATLDESRLLLYPGTPTAKS